MSEGCACSVPSIRKGTFKKLCLLYAVGKFQTGVYGKKRLHKVVYIAQRDSETRPFEFKKHHYGQYSDSMDDTLDQLLGMGYLVATPLDVTGPGHQGNKYELAAQDLHRYFSLFLQRVDPGLKRKIDKSIKNFGYLPEHELIEKVYQFPEFIHADPEEVILGEQLPDCLQARNMKAEDIEELEISLNPRFVNLLNRLDSAVEQSDFDPEKVKKVVELF